MRQTVSVLLAVVALTHGSAIPYPHATLSTQYHAQDELGQYSYGYAGGPSSKTETKTADGVVKGEYSYVDANGIIQTTSYIADPYHGFRVAATNLPVAPVAHDPIAPEHPVVSHAVPHAVPHAVSHAVSHAVPHAVSHAVPHLPHPLYVQKHHPTVYEAGLIPGVDTPEVQAARSAHLHAVAETKARDAIVNSHYPHGVSYIPYAPAHSHYSYYAPKDTPQVAAAKAAHFAAVHEAKTKIAHSYGHSYGYYPYAAHHSSHYVSVPVTDTPEVAHAKAAHFAAVHEAKSRSYHHSDYYPTYHSEHYPSYHVPVPVKDTPEVAAAKAAHLAVVHEAKANIAVGYPHYSHGSHYEYSYAPVPVPVTDTPAVQHAKAAHFAAVHHAKEHTYSHEW